MKHRKRRFARRERRYETEVQTSRNAVVLGTTAVFAIASFFLAFAHKLTGMSGGDVWIPIGLISLGFGLTFYGVMTLWSLTARNTPAGLFVWVIAALMGWGGMVGGFAWLPLKSTHPLQIHLPRVAKVHRFSADRPTLWTNGVVTMLGPAQFDASILIEDHVVASDQDLKIRAEAMVKRIATEREMMMRDSEAITADVAMDRCVQFGSFARDVKVLLDAGFVRVGIAVVGHDHFGWIQPYYERLPVSRVEDAPVFALRLGRESLGMSVDGQKVTSTDGCRVATFCAVAAARECEVQLDWQAVHERVVQAHAKYPEETVFEVTVDADVPLQAVVSLIDNLSHVDSFGSKMLLPDPLILLPAGP